MRRYDVGCRLLATAGVLGFELSVQVSVFTHSTISFPQNTILCSGLHHYLVVCLLARSLRYVRRQSAEYTPEEIVRRIDDFAVEFEESLAAMDETAIATHLQAFVRSRLKRPSNLQEESEWHWGEVTTRRYVR